MANRRSVSLRSSSGARYRTTSAGGNLMTGREGAVFTGAYIRGGPELARKLRLIEKATRDVMLAEVTRTGGEVVAGEWRQQVRSSVGLGPGIAHYAEAIDTLANPGKRGATAVVGLKKVAVSKGEAQPRDYASRLEFGSAGWVLGDKAAIITYNLDPSKITISKRRGGRRRVARPTLRPAFDASKGRALDAMGRRAWQLIGRAV